MSKISTKTIARIAATQALYQYQINGATETVDAIVFNMIRYYGSDASSDLAMTEQTVPSIKLNINYFSALVKQAIDNVDNIDHIITQKLTRYTLEDMHITLRALLRVAICELYYFPETPYKVVINEFTNMASDMLTDNEVAFVNSILDAVSKEQNRSEAHDPDKKQSS